LEKNLKRIKTVAVVLIVLLISAIAFGGLYIKNQGVWENVLKKFSYGMELDGIRELKFVLDTSEEEKEIYLDSEGNYAGDVTEEKETTSSPEISLVDESENPVDNAQADATQTETPAEPEENKEDDILANYTKEKRVIKANEDADINIDNFEKTKKIIQKRLETIDLYEYNIRLDNVTGELVLEVPDNDNVEIEESLVATEGKFEVVDHQNGLVLLNNSNIKQASATYTNNESGYQVYLIIQLDKEGTEKLKEISKTYVSKADEAGNTTTKYVSVELDDRELLETYFGDELTNGVLQIPLGQATENQEDFAVAYASTVRVAELLNLDTLPLNYQISADNYIQSSVTSEVKLIAIASFAVIVVILSIVMILKYKLNGIKVAILNVGYIAILTLALRYTNVLITINSLIAFVGVVGINVLFTFKLLENLKKSDDVKLVFTETMKELYLTIIPVAIIAVIFTFMTGAVISSIGMVLFWGLAVQALYSGLIYLIGLI